jgi:hypothetical protein
MTESLLLLSDFEKILLDRIEKLRGRMHDAHNPIYNENLMIEIKTLQWVAYYKRKTNNRLFNGSKLVCLRLGYI